MRKDSELCKHIGREAQRMLPSKYFNQSSILGLDLCTLLELIPTLLPPVPHEDVAELERIGLILLECQIAMIRLNVVGYSGATEGVLLRGLKDESTLVRMKVLEHPGVTEAVLLEGLKDESKLVRMNAINHPKATERVLIAGVNSQDRLTAALAAFKLR